MKTKTNLKDNTILEGVNNFYKVVEIDGDEFSAVVMKQKTLNIKGIWKKTYPVDNGKSDQGLELRNGTIDDDGIIFIEDEYRNPSPVVYLGEVIRNRKRISQVEAYNTRKRKRT